MPVIKLATQIAAPISRCFDLSRSIDLHKISARQTSEEAIGGITSGLIGLNETVTWSARHLGVTQKLTSKVTEFQYPDFFIDEMVKGIFKGFKHEHHFVQTGAITVMKDVFNYESPLGLLGQIADFIILKRYLKNLLEVRNTTIREFAESDRWKEVLSVRYE